ncbi:MAG: ASKHA domain-containing protein, partial [Monoglobales bacterium]
MFKITVKNNDTEKSLTFSEPILLSEALERFGINQHKPCGGKGICKKCMVTANTKEVLACQTYASDDTYIDYNTNEGDIQGLKEGYMTFFDKQPLVTEGYGLAVDIGTTTIAGLLYKFPECEIIESMAIANTQAAYGADVISRIEFSSSGGLDKLQKCAEDQIEKLSCGYKIDKYVITGNTTMLHLLTGLDPASIAVAPYEPKTLFGFWQDNVFLPKCISAYVGADMTCAILSSGILDDKTSFLVDIGTNGEMALWHGGTLVCCSTAAGPAFEGGVISQGTLAISGAIDKVFIENGEVKYTTIDDKKPIGVCGTGLIDAISCMKNLGVLEESGYLEEDFQIGNSGVYITAKDVRQVQLAKAAIRAGIDTLLHECNIDCAEIER